MSELERSPHIRELQWLARYYETHGHKQESGEILAELDVLRAQHCGDVIEMFSREEDEKQA